MLNKSWQTQKGRTTTIGIYLKFETHKKIKEKAAEKYTSMSTIVRQVIGKVINAKEQI
jgi:hypothetical protein